ncbi:RING finger protein 141 [Anabrus simplex]|uniref:RING finger protein 141 n=1 Tax=Anabrus simplex TaxID=316456 RepID=UPI0035A3C9F7
MGQIPSSDNIPETVETIQEDICRHARTFTEIAALTYEDFQKCLSELNDLSKKCTDPCGKRLVFAVKKGTDSTMLWKGTVRIACVKVDASTRQVDSYRLLNLSEFLKVFQTLQCQLMAAKQRTAAEEDCRRETNLNHTAEQSLSESSSSGNTRTEYDSIKYLTATMLLEEVDNATSRPGERLNECCICLERKPDVMLPCAHSYCLPCIEQWNVNNKTCPICRETLDSTDDTWVISEVPDSHEINETICKTLLGLASNSQVPPK